MIRRAFLFACFLTLAFATGVPTQALAHGGHAHPEIATAAEAALDAQSEVNTASQLLQSHSQPEDQPVNNCHCPACHGCCHAPALSEAPGQFVPFALRSHAASRDEEWSARRWRSAIENPPKTFA